jgi:hypothetical protein
MPGKEDLIVVCPMSPAQQAVYRRVVNSHDYVLLRHSEVPCECDSGEQRRDCCHTYVPLNLVECFDAGDIRLSDTSNRVPDPQTGTTWDCLMLAAIMKVGTPNFPCGPTPSKASAQLEAPSTIYSLVWAISQAIKVCNNLDEVRVCRKDPEPKQQRDRVFARVAFGSDDPAVIVQNDKLVSFDTLNHEPRMSGESKF